MHLYVSVAQLVLQLLKWISLSIYTCETPTQIFVCQASLNSQDMSRVIQFQM